jgi:MoaA/NifB/PqqE/SkfB family radical SAM enzyme
VIYLEIVYQCNQRCRMCPRDFDTTPQTLMAPEIFERALPALRRTPHVDFAGWGETLMSPKAVDYLHAIATRDFQCGLSTNAVLLDSETADRLVSGKAFYINVSIDGGCRETYRRIRGVDRFDKVLENLAGLMDIRNRRGSSSCVEWIFVMMKSNFRDLPKAVEIACEIGVDKFTGKHLELAATRTFMEEALWNNPYAQEVPEDLLREWDETLEECRNIARGRIQLSIHPLVHTDDFWKKRGPVFKVTACTFISPNNHRPFSNPEFHPDWVLGNVLDTPLEEIIRSEGYLRFQQTWMNGEIPHDCQGCPFSFRLDKDGLCHAL